MAEKQVLEISPDIILHKQQMREMDTLVYYFKIEVKKMNVVEFVADFTGSDNIEIEGRSNLITVTTIDPFSTSTIAKLILRRDWKLKSKFKFTLKTPAKSVQEKFLSTHLEELDRKVNAATMLLKKVPYSIMSIAEVNKFLTANGISLIDCEFLPTDASLYSSMVDTSNFDTVIQWRRPEDFMVVDDNRGLRKPTIFYDTIDPSDLKQGVLGDCWFMCALACIAERPSLIERLFVTKEYNPNGAYRLKLCKNGEWVTVTIDDYLPCFPLGSPIFSKNHGNEMWGLLLEKAYAKLHGNYFSLRGGYAHEALLDLTGCPTLSLQFDEDDIKSKVENGSLWEDMKIFEEEGYLMSVSTPGEDRWTDQGWVEDEDNNGLAPGHAYTIIHVKDSNTKGNKLVCLRNPWGNFEWKGDWGEKSPLWTDEIKQAVRPNLTGDDGTWWMSFDDLVKNFYCLNVCKVRNWDEVRIKGKFIKIQEIEDPDIEITLSKWYYSIEIGEKTKVVISIHQEDERISGVALNRPYLDISIAVLKRLQNNNVELVDFVDFKFERQVQLELELESGSYIVLPRTTGCSLKKSNELTTAIVPLVDRMGSLTDVFKSTVVDIFRKFDMLLNRELGFVEFKGFYECLNKSISEDDFKKDILKNYASSSKGLSQVGFIQFWQDKVKQLGEETIYGWLENLGYDRSMYSARSRCFLMNIHSTNEIAAVVRDAIQTDLDNKANALIIERFGKEMETKQGSQGVRALYHLSKSVHAYSYGVINDQNFPVEVTLNCSGSKEMVFSTKSAVIKKRVEPKQVEFMMHAEALQTVENFTRSAVCTWVNLKE